MKKRSSLTRILLAAVLVAGTLAIIGAPPVAGSTPNDPLYPQTTTPNRLGLWGIRQVRAPAAWDTATGSGGVIAVVDSGIDLDHEDLIGNTIAGKTFINCGNAGCGNGDWQSGGGANGPSTHGTHVAGTAAAVGNNGLGVIGVAPDAELLAIRVLSVPPGETSASGSFADIGRGIRWAAGSNLDGTEVAPRAHVVNLSLGGLPGFQALTITGVISDVTSAISYAVSRGVVVVASSGNDSAPLCGTPGFDPGALCVTATDSHEARAGYSNEPINQEMLAVAAPGGGEADFFAFCGGGILSTVPPGTGDTFCSYPANAAYGENLGTSMASPHVSGAAAVLAGMGCTGSQTTSFLTSTARQPFTEDPVTGEPVRGQFTPTYGYGIIDLEAAVAAADGVCSTPPPPPPLPPVAVDDAASTLKDSATTINVVANDSDPNGDPITVTAVTQGTNGAVVNNNDGTVTYTPSSGFVGVDNFTYTVSDPGNLSDTANVIVTVVDPGNPCDRPGVSVVTDPQGDQDAAFGTQQQDILELFSAGRFDPSHLEFTLVMDDLSSLPPNSSWKVVFSFGGTTYYVEMNTYDPTGPAFVYGTFDGTFYSEVGNADGGAIDAEDGTVMLRIAASKVGAPGLGSTLSGLFANTQLLIGGAGNGALEDIDETSAGSFIVGSCPGENLPPVAVADALTAVEGSSATINVVANDSDPNGQALTVTSVTQGTNGSVVNNGDGTVTYTPDTGYAGGDSFTYTISDGNGGFATGNVLVTVVTPCGYPGITVLTDAAGDATSGQPEHDVLSLTINERPSLGSGKIEFVLKMAGMANPTPNTTWPAVFRAPNGSDFFVRMATDGAGAVTFASGPGTNPNPFVQVGTPAPGSSFNADGTIRIVVSRANIGNPAAGENLTGFLTRIRTGESPGGAVTPDNMGGGSNSLTPIGSYAVRGSENCNLAPIAVGDAAQIPVDTPVTIDVLANDSDPNGDTLTVSAITQPANGVSANNGDGTVTYTPPSGFVGVISFAYTIVDGRGGSAVGIVTIRVDDGVAPAPPVITRPSAGSLNPKVVTFSGTAEPFSTVRIYKGTTLLATKLTKANGTWSIAKAMSEGLSTIYATARDSAGNVSDPSASVTFDVDAGIPSGSITTANNSVLLPNGTINGTGTDNRVVGRIVLVYRDTFGVVVGSQEADIDEGGDPSNVTWSIIPNVTGPHSATAFVYDVAGNSKAVAAIFFVKTL